MKTRVTISVETVDDTGLRTYENMHSEGDLLDLGFMGHLQRDAHQLLSRARNTRDPLYVDPDAGQE